MNDVSRLGAGEARLIVRHAAAASAVDVRAGGELVFRNLTNPNEQRVGGRGARRHRHRGHRTPGSHPRRGHRDDRVRDRLGANQSLTLTAQTIKGLHSAPGGVPSGDGGRAGTGLTTWWYVLAVAGALLLVGGGIRLATSRLAPARR